MKKIYTIGFVAALAMALLACSREEPVFDAPAEEQEAAQGYTLIVNAEKVASTKGLQNPVDKKIKTYWKAGEKVYAYQYNYSDEKWEELAVLTADASGNGSTQLHGTLNKVPNEGGFKLYLHSPSVDYSMQYGVLNESTPYSIEDHFDYAIANVIDFDVDETARTVTATCDGFTSQQAIVKFYLLDSEGKPLENLGTLVIEDQAEGYNKCMWIKVGPKDGNPTQEEHVFDGKVTVDCYRNAEIYVALSNVSTSSMLHLTASTAKTDSEPYVYTYTYDKTGVRFENGCYYEINVKMKKDPIDLSRVDASFTAVDGDVLTGKLGMHKITIADKATVTLRNVDISHTDYPEWSTSEMCRYAGLNLEGGATIVLEGTNKVSGFHQNYPGIYIPAGKKIYIKGSGSLEARSGGRAAGIGGTYGEIIINGGTITAYGGEGAAGIGSGYQGICADMMLWSGTITAFGGTDAPGIGSGSFGRCGSIASPTWETITAHSGSEGVPDVGAGLHGSCEGIAGRDGESGGN